MKRRTTITG